MNNKITLTRYQQDKISSLRKVAQQASKILANYGDDISDNMLVEYDNARYANKQAYYELNSYIRKLENGK